MPFRLQSQHQVPIFWKEMSPEKAYRIWGQYLTWVCIPCVGPPTMKKQLHTPQPLFGPRRSTPSMYLAQTIQLRPPTPPTPRACTDVVVRFAAEFFATCNSAFVDKAGRRMFLLQGVFGAIGLVLYPLVRWVCKPNTYLDFFFFFTIGFVAIRYVYNRSCYLSWNRENIRFFPLQIVVEGLSISL